MKSMTKIWMGTLGLTKRDIWAAIIATLITVAMIADNSIFHHQLLEALFIADGVGIGIVLIIMMVISSFRIMKSLIEVSAGLSLLIFLAETYCDAPARTASSDAALRGFLALGLLYLSYYFLRTLWGLFTTDIKKFRSQGKSWEATTFVVLYAVFTILFIWDIWIIMTPIVQGLCIYR